MAWSSRSSSSTRLGRPVSASCVARCRSWSLAASSPMVRTRDHVFERLRPGGARTCSSCHLRVSALAHCRTSMGSKGFFRTSSLSEWPEPLDEIRPVVVRVRRADHDLHVRIDRPQMFDGLEPVPARGHAHVDEGEREGTSVRGRAARPASRPARLAGRTAISNDGCVRRRVAVAEQDPLGLRHVGLGLARPARGSSRSPRGSPGCRR